MADYVMTHRLGSKCGDCGTVLVEDECRCGRRHGYADVKPSEWAAWTWPTHPCFLVHLREDGDAGP